MPDGSGRGVPAIDISTGSPAKEIRSTSVPSCSMLGYGTRSRSSSAPDGASRPSISWHGVGQSTSVVGSGRTAVGFTTELRPYQTRPTDQHKHKIN